MTMAVVRSLMALLVCLLGLLLPPPPASGGEIAAQPSRSQCRFALGFASLRDQIVQAEGADPVGACLEDEYHALSGDGVQWTSRGLFVWRKTANWTGFTDGRQTWVSGPAGVVKRSNVDLLPWETSGRQDAAGFLSAPTGDLPPAAEVDEAIRQVYVLHGANGGSTFSLHFGDMGGRKLYAVSLYPERGIVVPGKQVSLEVLRRFLLDNRDLLVDPRVSVGTWFNEDNGMTYLDISATVPDRQQAVDLGRKYNQISIFDLHSFEEIETGGTGEKIPNLPPAASRLPEMPALRR